MPHIYISNLENEGVGGFISDPDAAKKLFRDLSNATHIAVDNIKVFINPEPEIRELDKGGKLIVPNYVFIEVYMFGGQTLERKNRIIESIKLWLERNLIHRDFITRFYEFPSESFFKNDTCIPGGPGEISYFGSKDEVEEVALGG